MCEFLSKNAILQANKIALTTKKAPFKLPNTSLKKYKEKIIIQSAIIKGAQLLLGPKEF